MNRLSRISKTAGLIGFGAFGQLAARPLASRMPLLVHDPTWPPGNRIEPSGPTLAGLAEAAGCPIVILAVPVGELKRVVGDIKPHLRLRSLVLDVGSVKVRPAQIMRDGLPSDIDIVATHPLFGPQSASDGIRGLKVAVCPIRGGRAAGVAAFLRRPGLHVIMTTPEEHDREAALVQGLTHLIAKVLVQMEPLPTRMTTRSFELLMQGSTWCATTRPRFFAQSSRPIRIPRRCGSSSSTWPHGWMRHFRGRRRSARVPLRAA